MSLPVLSDSQSITLTLFQYYVILAAYMICDHRLVADAYCP